MIKATVGQIGVGYWGPNLLRNLVMNRRCDVKTVVEISKERREFVRERYPDIRVVENVTELVDDESIDAVVVSTPAKTHFELAKRILEAGKHVLVEKPMARYC